MPKNHGMTSPSRPRGTAEPTWVAGVAEVAVDPESGEIDLQKLTIAMDMGIAINPGNAVAQIKGAALWGASQVLSERLTVKDGAFEQHNFDTYLPIRLSQVPEIDVEIVESGNHPSGVGEPSSTVVAPAWPRACSTPWECACGTCHTPADAVKPASPGDRDPTAAPEPRPSRALPYCMIAANVLPGAAPDVECPPHDVRPGPRPRISYGPLLSR